ncbi:MAG: branched-chain amino acid transaminase [Armatimonadota bacterium]|nr:branched-chain amino acid transaminase [Armatimonadota bacterium]MDR7421675.1 branched-chain amino acid transaminase [Armatimonadota bacterium]MDR7454608.1 branched-chain amino acid transaminase [Armatimonadota bacterium]MDR7456540.1 branched-chain amino acid transaminase [Armatimonadota bacterium]MDR7495853.1 branched-chain amino acid transaminase [Armatimonadota bacterium]
MDGALVPWEDAKIHVAAHVVHYGSSVFEGIRCYETASGPAVFCLEPHVRRLEDSCRIFRMPLSYSREELSRAILDTVGANGHRSCYIRPVVFRGVESFAVDHRKCPLHVAVITIEWGRYLGAEAIEQGVDVMVSSWRRMAPDTHPGMGKIGGNYVNSAFVVMEATDNGFAEGIALDVGGTLSEGSGENLFVVRDGVVLTPPLAASILGGVTRTVVLRLCRDLGIEVREMPIPREMLYVADEVFFTGTAAEITPVRSVDRVPVGAGRRGPITARLQEEFFGITAGRLPDRHGWLTPVPVLSGA